MAEDERSAEEQALHEFVERGRRAELEARAAAAGAGATPETPANLFLVGAGPGDRITIARIPVVADTVGPDGSIAGGLGLRVVGTAFLTKGEALNLAAWLVALADYEAEFATFRALLEAVSRA